MNKFKHIIVLLLIVFLVFEVILITKGEEKVDAKTFILNQKECQKARGYNKCLEEHAKEITSKYEFNEILSAYQDLGYEKGTSYSCHDAMHHIAAIEFKKQKNLPQIFHECNSSCFNACYHGAVLGALEEDGIEGLAPDEISKNVSVICDTLGREKEIYFDDCIHGVGHALMLVTNNALPESLSACDNTESPTTCYGGVFMENFPISSTSDHPSKYLQEDDPLYPCNSLSEKYKGGCYTFLTAHLMVKHKWSYEESFNKCAAIFPKDYQNICFTSLGISVIGNTENKFKNYYEVCKLAKEEKHIDACVRGVVISYYDRYKGIWEKYNGMFEFCAEVDVQFKQTCYGQIGYYAEIVYKTDDERQHACGLVIDKEFMNLCMDEEIN